MKVNERTLEGFISFITETIAKTVADARASGVSDDDIKKIITQNYEEHGRTSDTRVLTRIRKQLLSQIEIKAAAAVKGCLIGSYDRAGKNSPIRYLLLKKDKKHIEISNFGNKTKFGTEEEYPIPVPSLVTLRVTPEVDYNTWKLNGIEEITSAAIDPSKLIGVLSAVSIEPKAITKEMAWSKEKAATPVVIFGTIARIRPEVIFKRDNEDGPAHVDKTLPVWIETDDGMKPCFNFGLKAPGGKYIRCHIKHQRYGRPTLLVEDIASICERAVQKHSSDPEAQAQYLNEWLEELPVVVAGIVSSYRETFDAAHKATTNVEIGVAAVIETPENQPAPTGTPQQGLSSTPPPAAESKKEETPKSEPAKAEASESMQAPGADKVGQVMKDIKLWCTAANVDPTSLSLALIREKATSRYLFMPDGAIVEAIERIKNGE